MAKVAQVQGAEIDANRFVRRETSNGEAMDIARVPAQCSIIMRTSKQRRHIAAGTRLASSHSKQCGITWVQH